MRRLFIAEKKSLADAIASAFPNVQKTQEGYKAGDDFITWAAGHILKLKYPDEIEGGKYKEWTLSNLPIIPQEWESMSIPSPATKNLLSNIQKLLKQADSVVNAGDADREGQLLIDEILKYCNYKKPVKRLLLTDLSVAAIQKSIAEMKDNSEYIGVSHAGLGRQRADWLIGQNLTRAYTITTPRKMGEITSVGRVQTPTLALVVHRDLEIENFISKPYFQAKAEFQTSAGNFWALWKPSEDLPCMDEQNRIIDYSAIEDLRKKLSGHTGNITSFNRKTAKKAPPKPHSLPQLQIEANKEYGFAPATTLEICQKLYENRVLTYPRSDCQYLPMSIYEDRQKIIEAIRTKSPDLVNYLNDASFNADLKRNCFDDTKIEEHFAIIPTATTSQHQLTADEQKIYDLVAKRFVSQFMGDQEFDDITINVTCEEELFTAHSCTQTSAGWNSLYVNAVKEDDEAEEDDSVSSVALPILQAEMPASFNELKSIEKKTTPPKHFTEATLLSAMNNIHKYVKDENIRKVLKDVQGIGTAATQARIIEDLLGEKRGYLVKSGRNIIATEKGKTLISHLDPLLVNPDLTALWEMRLAEIAKGALSLDTFIAEVTELTSTLVNTRKKDHTEVKTTFFKNNTDFAKKEVCPVCKKENNLVQMNGKYGKYWLCRDCNLILSDERGKPGKCTPCTKCGKGIAIRKKGKEKYYWKCNSCGAFFSDNKGKIVL